MDLILDTNALSAIAEGEREAAKRFVRSGRVAIPVIVLGECRFGIAHSRHQREYERWLEEMVSVCNVLEVNEETAIWYAELRGQLKKDGTPDPFQRRLDCGAVPATYPLYLEPRRTFRLGQGVASARLVSRIEHKPRVRLPAFSLGCVFPGCPRSPTRYEYQAASWKTVRRVVAKVEHHAGELFPRVGFIVTNLNLPNRVVVRFYNKRGTAEQWIKEGKQAVKMTRLSCHRLRSNEVRLWLSVIAYNLGNLWRRLVLPRRIGNWSLTSLQQRLVKTGGRLLKHARYYWLLLAESHLTRRLFGAMARRIEMLPLPAG